MFTFNVISIDAIRGQRHGSARWLHVDMELAIPVSLQQDILWPVSSILGSIVGRTRWTMDM